MIYVPCVFGGGGGAAEGHTQGTQDLTGRHSSLERSSEAVLLLCYVKRILILFIP